MSCIPVNCQSLHCESSNTFPFHPFSTYALQSFPNDRSPALLLPSPFAAGSDLDGFPLHWRVNADEYLFHFLLPGFRKDDLKVVLLDDNFLEIRGERHAEKVNKTKTWLLMDWSGSVTVCRFHLPADAMMVGIKAVRGHGTVTVTVPRTEETVSRGENVERTSSIIYVNSQPAPSDSPRLQISSKQAKDVQTVSSKKGKQIGDTAAPVSSNKQFRPLLDAVDRLRLLNVMKEGIQLPTIVVVGDQSSGKSGVLESLAGISLPCGQSVCTRVPLIMRLINDPSADDPLLQLEYQGRVVHTSESDVTDAISLATTEIAGDTKGIPDVTLTLIVKKKGVPDLTLVDLPSIPLIPIDGLPENIYEQISQIIMKHIAPKESIILNVLSAGVDFSTCESTQMSQRVDNSGERTLAVVTKADMAPQGLLEKVTSDDIKIGLGYVCVRNRVANETYEEAREEEAKLFREDPSLSSMDKSSVGICMLAQKLKQIQVATIAKCFLDISNQIDEKLNHNTAELEKMPENLSTKAGTTCAFMRILSASKVSLTKLLICGDFDEFPDDKEMEASIRIFDMHDAYSKNLSGWPDSEDKFLMEEIRVLEKRRDTFRLPGLSPHSAFSTILKRKLKSIADSNHQFVVGVWDYIAKVVSRVLLTHTQNYFPKLQSSITMAAQNVVDKMRKRSIATVKENIEMEMAVCYTSNPDYTKTYELIVGHESHGAFKAAIHDCKKPTTLTLEVLGTVCIAHLRRYGDLADLAFVLRARLVAFWKCMAQRLVDGMMVHLLYSIKCLVDNEMEVEIMTNLAAEGAAGLETMMEESPAIRTDRERLLQSIEVLKESKGVLASISQRGYSAYL